MDQTAAASLQGKAMHDARPCRYVTTTCTFRYTRTEDIIITITITIMIVHSEHATPAWNNVAPFSYSLLDQSLLLYSYNYKEATQQRAWLLAKGSRRNSLHGTGNHVKTPQRPASPVLSHVTAFPCCHHTVVSALKCKQTTTIS